MIITWKGTHSESTETGDSEQDRSLPQSPHASCELSHGPASGLPRGNGVKGGMTSVLFPVTADESMIISK